ncbi:MAG TPA: glutamate formimidoyltransferase [Syntrophorhabdaceae bacterium]|nr:glutamate formimidoyltransferase [Syntrophorhabdaceae bacterium]
MKKILETVPNFSEGRDKAKIKKILGCFDGVKDVRLLGHHKDKDHNRLVVSAAGEPARLKKAVLEAVRIAVDIIDMRKHKGEHPRMGAVDVIPFIPIKDMSMEDAVKVSKDVARSIWQDLRLPVFLYEESAQRPERKSLADIRRGQFEGMKAKIKKPEWKPDFGTAAIHPTAGVVAVGARKPLVAFNVNLDTESMVIANAIARAVRHQNGGLRYCRAIAIDLKERGIVQVSMNMTDYTQTPLYRALEMVRMEAKRYGVNVAGSEIVGLVPADALVESASYYMGLENFTTDQVLEMKLIE